MSVIKSNMATITVYYTNFDADFIIAIHVFVFKMHTPLELLSVTPFLHANTYNTGICHLKQC